MKRYVDLMMQLIRSQVCRVEVDLSAWLPLDEEALTALYRLSKKHDMAHIVGKYLEKNGLLPLEAEVTAKYKKQINLAIYRYQRSRYELETLCEALEASGIPFMPLKGSVLREQYPEPWMRTSCDIDVLVHEKDRDAAAEYLAAHLNYRREEDWGHDVSLFSPGGIHVELHYTLMNDGLLRPETDKVLHRVWDHTTLKEGCACHHIMNDEMFYVYHMAHMAKHIKYGGCGIRPLLDLWILEHVVPHDGAARAALSEKAGLTDFNRNAHALSDVWFAGAEATETTQGMQDYIILGGVYGNKENRMAVQQKETGGKAGYAMHKIFPPMTVMKTYYPTLRKHAWLVPFFHVRRWFGLVFGGGAKRSVKVLKDNQGMTEEQRRTADFIDGLGI